MLGACNMHVVVTERPMSGPAGIAGQLQAISTADYVHGLLKLGPSVRWWY